MSTAPGAATSAISAGKYLYGTGRAHGYVRKSIRCPILRSTRWPKERARGHWWHRNAATVIISTSLPILQRREATRIFGLLALVSITPTCRVPKRSQTQLTDLRQPIPRRLTARKTEGQVSAAFSTGFAGLRGGSLQRRGRW